MGHKYFAILIRLSICVLLTFLYPTTICSAQETIINNGIHFQKKSIRDSVGNQVDGWMVIGDQKAKFDEIWNIENICIEEEINGLPVIGVDNYAFADCSWIKSAILPSSLSDFVDGHSVLGHGIFSGCTNLTTAIFYCNKIKEIPQNTFNSCKSLKQFRIPDTVKTIGEHAFSSAGLETIMFPDGLNRIGQFAFSQCKSIRVIRFPNNLYSIGSGAFSQVPLEEIYFPPSLKSFDTSYGFDDATDGTKIYISDLSSFCDLNVYETWIFDDDTSYLNRGGMMNKSYSLLIDNAIVEEYTDNKGHLPHILFPCGSIKKITSGETIKTWDVDLWCGFKNLTTINITANVREVRFNSWNQDVSHYSTLSINCLGVTPPALRIDDMANNFYFANLHVPKGCLKTYQQDNNWSRFSNIIDDLDIESGIDNIKQDVISQTYYYRIDGLPINENDLKSGIYIKKHGSKVEKIIVN